MFKLQALQNQGLALVPKPGDKGLVVSTQQSGAQSLQTKCLLPSMSEQLQEITPSSSSLEYVACSNTTFQRRIAEN